MTTSRLGPVVIAACFSQNLRMKVAQNVTYLTDVDLSLEFRRDVSTVGEIAQNRRECPTTGPSATRASVTGYDVSEETPRKCTH